MNKIINLQIIKVYPLQQNSLISICLDQSEHQERLYFGTSQEPSNRLSAFHDLNLFVKKSFYFLHRNSQEIYQGLIPILYGSFYRNQFTNMLFYGPPGIVQFLIEIRFIIGIRHLAFAGYDLQKKKQTLEKYGVGNRSQFIQALKDYQASQLIDKPLPVLNEYVEKITTDIVKPSEYIENNTVSCSFANIIPIYSQNNNVIQYLILFKKSKSVNLQWLQQNKIDHKNINQGKFINQNEQNDNSLLTQAMLILNFENEREIIQFNQKFDQINDHLIQYSKLIDQKQRLIIIHDSCYTLLNCQIYKDLINQFKSLSYNITHIVTSNEVYQELPKEAIKDLGRERKGYYYLDYLECMKNILPTYFRGRILINQFEKNSKLHNINELWKGEEILLPMKMKTMQIEQGQIYYENIKIDRSIQFSPKSEILQLLSRLHKIQYSNYNQENTTFKLTVLGTASSCETQSRCTSSWHVQLQDQTGILLDCGQNALSQLYFSSEIDQEFEDKIQNIKIIYISHFHNDHNQGLMDFLGKKCQISKDQCYVILPNNLFQWYDQQLTQLFQDKFQGQKYYDQIKIINTKQFFNLHEQEYKLKYTPFKIQNLETQRTPRSVSIFGYHNKHQDELFQTNLIQFKQLLSDINLQIQLNYSYHCEQATNIKLIHNNKTLIYSSDRLGAFDVNTKKFIEFSKNCDILIHECTFPDNLNDRAYVVLHSTFLQALLTAQSANAKNLILTHYTDRLLFNIKNLMDFEGTIDKVQFANNIKLNASWPEQINVDKLYTYFKDKTVFANDFQILTEQSIPQLPQISRIIVKMLQP